MPICAGSTLTAREQWHKDGNADGTTPPEYFDGPAGHRVAMGDAMYILWILRTVRQFANARYGVSTVMHKLGGDQQLAQLGYLTVRERWMVGQVAFHYWEQCLDQLVELNREMDEADVAPTRGWSTARRPAFYWCARPKIKPG